MQFLPKLLKSSSSFNTLNRFKSNLFRHISIGEEVKSSLINQRPVVALESTIITHGMPYPKNVECALDVEREVRKNGAVPATIAILNGEIKVGLTQVELKELAEVREKKPVKTSRRDMAYVIANKLNGGTTVSGTLLVCDKVGISIFATGGIGGVHRFGEKTFDVSSDLIELGKSRVAVFSSGVKSILDISKTLEFLETQGVFVATYGNTTEFPAFYCSKSGHHVPYSIRSPSEAANVIFHSHSLSLNSGLLFGVPVPEEFSLNEKEIETVIGKALDSAKNENVIGKDVTPYLLAKIVEATGGKSLLTNVALVKNNAGIAAKVAVELSRKESNSAGGIRSEEKGRAVIIGGSVLDRCATIADDEIKGDSGGPCVYNTQLVGEISAVWFDNNGRTTYSGALMTADVLDFIRYHGL